MPVYPEQPRRGFITVDVHWETLGGSNTFNQQSIVPFTASYELRLKSNHHLRLYTTDPAEPAKVDH